MKTISLDDDTYGKLIELASCWRHPRPEAYLAAKITDLHRDRFGPLEVQILVGAPLHTDEIGVVTRALAKYDGRLSYPSALCAEWTADLPVVDIGEEAADGHASVIARAIWRVLGGFVDITVTGTNGGESRDIYFDREAFDQRDIGIPDTRGGKRRGEDEAVFAMLMQEAAS